MTPQASLGPLTESASRPRKLRSWPPHRLLTRSEAIIVDTMADLTPPVADALDRWNRQSEPG